MHAHRFTAEEVEILREVCNSAAFLQKCWRAREKYKADCAGATPSPRPSEERERYRALYRHYARDPSANPRPALRALDAAEVALIDQTAGILFDARKRSRAAAAFATLLRQPAPRKHPLFAEESAAFRLARIFDEFGLPVTDYEEGAAAKVLAVVLRSEKDNIDFRHLFRKVLNLRK
ncbi:MAG: hypothetical protein ACOZDY_11035 [Pseudomonadota bacterium]